MTLFRKLKLSPKTGRRKSRRYSKNKIIDQSFKSLDESTPSIVDSIGRSSSSIFPEKEGNSLNQKINQNLSLSIAINDIEIPKDIVTYNCFEDINTANTENKIKTDDTNKTDNIIKEDITIKTDSNNTNLESENKSNSIASDTKGKTIEVLNTNNNSISFDNSTDSRIEDNNNLETLQDSIKDKNLSDIDNIRESNISVENKIEHTPKSLDKVSEENSNKEILNKEIEEENQNKETSEEIFDKETQEENLNKETPEEISNKEAQEDNSNKENSSKEIPESLNNNIDIEINKEVKIENNTQNIENTKISLEESKGFFNNNTTENLNKENNSNTLSQDIKSEIKKNILNDIKPVQVIKIINSNLNKSKNYLKPKMDIQEEKFENDITASLISLKPFDPEDIPTVHNNIEAVTHYTLVVNNKQLYKSTIKFYVNLGFNIDNLNSKYNLKHDFEATTWEDQHYIKRLVEYSEDEHPLYDEETWLSLINDNGKIALRIVENLHKDFAVADFSQASDEKLHQLLLEHASVENAYMSFSGNLDKIETIFKEIKRPYKLLKSPVLGTDLVYKQIYTYDPLLNLLEFHDESAYSKFMDVTETSEQSQKKKYTNEKPEKKIAIMTSGKETSGMNAAIRALVRCGLTEKITPYIIFNGFKGLVKGGSSIKSAGWEDVRDLLPLGGTVLDSSDCSYIETHESRLQAAKNLYERGIKNLVIIGDNESFSYAVTLQNEWNDLINELINNNVIEEPEINIDQHILSVIALPATIDNDIAMTDLTLGTCTSLQRICEALDSLESTATSHQRCFIIKVVGKRCGWLALMAAIAVGADCAFIPERPPPLQKNIDITWEEEMCDILKTKREKGNRKNIIVVSEGATDKDLNPITASYIKEVIEKKLGIDTRITTLGHIQREGIPCAYDRFLATVQAAEIITDVLNAKEDEQMSNLIGVRNNTLIRIPLTQSVKLTTSISEALANKQFDIVMNLRDLDFKASYNAYIESTLFSSNSKKLDEENRLRIGIIHVGSPAGGMNAATRAAVRLCLNRGHTPVGIFNSFKGLVRGEVKPLAWQEVSGWTTIGGSKLGINHSQPTPVLNSKKLYNKTYKIDPSELIDIGLIAYHLQEQNIQGLLIIGGYEAYCSLYTLYEAKSIYPSLCIPMVQIAASVSNNIPGTDHSIGSDTALNTIVKACDHIKLSASASQKRVFIVEVQGGNCGYLSTMGGLACGVTCTYGPENGITLNKLKNDIRHLRRRYKEAELKGIKNEGRIIIRNEFTSSSTYSTKVISAILNEEGKGLFDSRTAILGHLQQGGIPSPLDRIRAVRQAVECINWLEKKTMENKRISSYKEYHKFNLKKNDFQGKLDKEAYVIGIRGDKLEFTPIHELIKETNIDLRKSNHHWWMRYYPLIKILSKYYYFDANDETDIDYLTNEKNL